ncbi:hypothetical protein, conserved in T. vivax [Trypanosoma vivax Y486]|uniref:Uncharacterized protein n=1 Tax=Trypanosoma vivax (strain Y486) TaxID=1055687 RepID=F9WV60_TRYVY|nr:hypothetical protein, conserved in T. vivax [Trypanosoma vivax Y486]|eukprot:CCD21465.1 hypothetical protein, conserved in T. vivax [Trypanosoma vivax Y486]
MRLSAPPRAYNHQKIASARPALLVTTDSQKNEKLKQKLIAAFSVARPLRITFFRAHQSRGLQQKKTAVQNEKMQNPCKIHVASKFGSRPAFLAVLPLSTPLRPSLPTPPFAHLTHPLASSQTPSASRMRSFSPRRFSSLRRCSTPRPSLTLPSTTLLPTSCRFSVSFIPLARADASLVRCAALHSTVLAAHDAATMSVASR